MIPKYFHIGNAIEIRTPATLAEYDIEAVVDIAYEESPAAIARHLMYIRIPLMDGQGNPPLRLRLAIENLSYLVAQKIKTVVACSAGMSRSPSLAAIALSSNSNLTPIQAIETIAARKSVDVHPGFWSEFTKEFEKFRNERYNT